MRAYLSLPRTVHVLCAGVFVNRAGTFVMAYLALYVSRGLGFEAEIATLALGAFGVGSIAASLLGGVLADRFGRRPVMLTALFGGAVVLTVLPFLTSRVGVVLGVMAFALVNDMYRPASSAMLADVTTAQERPRAYALMYVAVNLGFAVGAVVGGILAELSFTLMFWTDAASAMVFGVIIYAFVVDSRVPVVLSAGGDTQLPPAKSMGFMLRDRTFMVVCLSTFLAGMVFHQSIAAFALELSSHGIGPAAYGRIFAVNGVMIVILQLPLASWLVRFHRADVLALGLVLNGIGFGVTAFASTPAGFVGTVMIWTLGEILHAAFASPVITDLAPPELRASYFGAFTVMFGAALAVGPPLGGVVYARLGSGWLWGGCLVVGLISAALIVSVRGALTPPPVTTP